MGIVSKSKYDLIFVAFVSLVAYWIHSVAWPLHPGRDWGAYLSVLELIKDGNLFQKHSLVDLPNSGPVISHFPPVTPLVTGFILFLGGPILLEISLSLAFCFVNFATYTISSFLILSFDVLIAAGLILSFIGEKRSSSFYRSSNIDGDRVVLAIKTYKYISVGLVLCFLTIWLPLAYSLLIDNI